jgi:hypothetical protein
MNDEKDKFEAFYAEAWSEMRWRRDSEYRYFTFCTGLFVACIIGLGTVLRVLTSPTHVIAIAVVLGLICLISAILTGLKIGGEHKVYEKVGSSIVEVWRYWKLLPEPGQPNAEHLLPIDAAKLGKGKGYMLTILMIAIPCVLTIAFLVSIALIGPPPQSGETQKSKSEISIPPQQPAASATTSSPTLQPSWWPGNEDRPRLLYQAAFL